MGERISTAEARDLSAVTSPLTERLLAADLLDARAELAALHAILDGRTVGPTEAEAIAHAAAGGWYLVTWSDETVPGPPGQLLGSAPDIDHLLRSLARLGAVGRVFTLNRDRQPCAWPVTP